MDYGILIGHVVAAIVFVVLVLLVLPVRRARDDLTLKSAKRLDDGDYVLRLVWNGREFSVRGQCTVWHYYPSGTRCSTPTESRLACVWKRLEWERKDSGQ